jgi:hypothetical protein
VATGDFSEWRHWRTLGRAEFATRFAHPFLLRRRLARTSGVPSSDFGDRMSFDTQVVDVPAAPPADVGRLTGARLVPVLKAPGHAFPDRISVGRATNCDIVLRDPSVSKLHAHFRVLGPGAAELTDVRSANRTSVNGSLLEPGTATRVTSGDTILFGVVAVQFLDPRALFELL